MFTPTDFLWNAVLPLIVASVAMIGGALARRGEAIDGSPWRWLLPLGIALGVPASMAACFPNHFGQLAESKHYLWIAFVAPALIACVIDAIGSLFRARGAHPGPAHDSFWGPGYAPRALDVIFTLVVIAAGVATILYRKTQIPGTTGWSLGTYVGHVAWMSIAGTVVSLLLSVVSRRECSLAVPIVLGLTSLLAAAWLLFGAAAFEPARIAGMFGWSAFAIIAATVVHRSNAASTLLIATVVAGWCVIAAYGTTFTQKPDRMIIPIAIGPLAMLVGLVPFVARSRTWIRMLVLVLVGLLIGATALGLSAKAYADASVEAEKKPADTSNPYGGYGY
jgi:hypothetical protein